MAQSVPGGSKRGVVILFQGLKSGTPPVIPVPIADIIVPFVVESLQLTLTNKLVADGWVVIFPPDASCFSDASPHAGNPSFGIFNDVNTDAGNGSRLKAQSLHWWDHLVVWIKTNYGAWPLVPFGSSWGGWFAYTVAANRTADITAYGGHCGVTILSDVNNAIPTWTTLTSSGADVTATSLNAVTGPPGYIGWSTTDTAVGDTDLMALKTAALGAGCPITTLQDNTNGHGLYTTDIGPGGSGFTGTTIMDWFTGTVDPLAPAIH